MTDQPTSIEEAAEWARQAADLQAQADELLAGVQAALPTLRAAAGVSQTALSSFSGVAANYVSRVESGARGVTSDALVKVTEGLQQYVSHGALDDLSRARGKERKQ
jgi:transcriptional regulator with XRE-family HTH domain